MEDGEPVVVLEKERLTRVKHDKGAMDIGAILEEYGWNPETIDAVVISPWIKATLDGGYFDGLNVIFVDFDIVFLHGFSVTLQPLVVAGQSRFPSEGNLPMTQFDQVLDCQFGAFAIITIYVDNVRFPDEFCGANEGDFCTFKLKNYGTMERRRAEYNKTLDTLLDIHLYIIRLMDIAKQEVVIPTLNLIQNTLEDIHIKLIGEDAFR